MTKLSVFRATAFRGVGWGNTEGSRHRSVTAAFSGVAGGRPARDDNFVWFGNGTTAESGATRRVDAVAPEAGVSP